MVGGADLSRCWWRQCVGHGAALLRTAGILTFAFRPLREETCCPGESGLGPYPGRAKAHRMDCDTKEAVPGRERLGNR